MARRPWEAKQRWILRPGYGEVPLYQHGLRTRIAGGGMRDFVEIVLTNVTSSSIAAGEVSLWIDEKDRRALIIALGGEPNRDPYE